MRWKDIEVGQTYAHRQYECISAVPFLVTNVEPGRAHGHFVRPRRPDRSGRVYHTSVSTRRLIELWSAHEERAAFEEMGRVERAARREAAVLERQSRWIDSDILPQLAKLGEVSITGPASYSYGQERPRAERVDLTLTLGQAKAIVDAMGDPDDLETL